MEVCKYMKGINKEYASKVLVKREQSRPRCNRFKLDKFRFRKDKARIILCRWMKGLIR